MNTLISSSHKDRSSSWWCVTMPIEPSFLTLLRFPDESVFGLGKTCWQMFSARHLRLFQSKEQTESVPSSTSGWRGRDLLSGQSQKIDWRRATPLADTLKWPKERTVWKETSHRPRCNYICSPSLPLSTLKKNTRATGHEPRTWTRV